MDLLLPKRRPPLRPGHRNPITDRIARPSKPLPTVSQGIRSAVSSMATSIANASMLRWSNLPPSATRRLHRANKRSKLHTLAGRPTLANRRHLGLSSFIPLFAQSFSQESAGRGAYLSCLSQSAFFSKSFGSRERNEVIENLRKRPTVARRPPGAGRSKGCLGRPGGRRRLGSGREPSARYFR